MSRQFPVITPALVLLKLLDDYTEAVLVGARVAACFSAFIISKNPNSAYLGLTTDADGAVKDPLDETRRVQKLQPGSVFYLKPYEEIQFAAPNRPGDNVDPFIVRIYKTISMYVRIPYPILFLDLGETNYSSWRGGVNELKKMIIRWRRELTSIITWIVNTIVLEGMANGEIRGNFNTLSVKVRWPSIGILDPEKEARANKYRLDNGTASKQMVCDEEGISYEEVQAEIFASQELDLENKAKLEKKRVELEQKYGIELVIDPAIQKNDTPDAGDEDAKKDKRKDDGNW
jgi:capsid protein